MASSRKRPQPSRPSADVPRSNATVQPRHSSSLRELLGIDVRTLAVFRIAIAIALLTDLGIRSFDWVAMYSDQGMFPRPIICRCYTTPGNWSFHFGSGAWEFQALLFLLTAVFGVALLWGYHTRFATIACWILTISLHNRVPPILQGGDNLLRMLLFWGMFLPLGAVWSRDSSRSDKPTTTSGRPVFSVATIAILMQMAMMYLFSAVAKTNEHWLGGTAIVDTLPHSFYGSPLGQQLLPFTGLLTSLTIFVLWIEWLGPFLMFSPLRNAWVRLVIVGLLAAMHLGIAILLNVGMFSFVSMCGLILFLPGFVWDWCLGTSPELPPVETPSSRSRRRTPATSRTQLAGQVVCGVAFLFVIFLNFNSLPERFRLWRPVPENDWLAIGCGLGQQWNMFDEPPSRDGWYVGYATLADGQEVDLLRDGQSIDWERPEDPASAYPNHRWLKCFREMAYADVQGYQVFRRPVAEYLCKHWNQQHRPEQQVAHFSFVFCTLASSPYTPGSETTERETFVALDASDL